MNQAKWIHWLEESLSDFRLDDQEKKYLQNQLAEQALSSEERAFLRNQSFKMAKMALLHGSESTAVLNWLERVVKLIDNTKVLNSKLASSWFSPGRSCITGIMEQLKLARNFIDICVFTIADDDLTKHILRASQRGVEVRIITDNDKVADRGSDVDYLARKGIPIKIDTTPYHMHHKFAIFDKQRLINGSFNWTRSASKYNQEDITLSDDVRFVNSFSRQFEQLWQRFPCYQPSQY
ncbi:hypothetical protein GCM10007938_37170 [Vibrio zhanjiangensis]|uniref:phospholipase D n=1 Tax=Vibrio zhanjiangensis TaxID=1046128 RepID=A0ABQ6F3V9_9VIBR|nr:phospholipase D-like domain-containing protein [Vibrio zhanjiangensis]GLT19934.1 hypothetical protein GCM10007938_37170 [Vibrio zhanjiangensis]